MNTPLTKQEVIKAVERKGPERIPAWYNWFDWKTVQKYGPAIERLQNTFSDDIIVQTLTFWPEDIAGKSSWVDEYGVRWDAAPDGVGACGEDSELRDWNNLDDYLAHRFPPNLDKPGRFDHIKQAAADNPDRYVPATWWLCQLEMLRALRGTEHMLLDLYEHRSELVRMGEALTDFFIDLIGRLADCGVDGIMLSDDFGTQQSLLMSPDDWREIFKPWYRKMIEAIHTRGKHAWLHTCGNIATILPDLIEIGLDVIHPIQPNTMDQDAAAEQYKGQITFFGGIDVQGILPFGTPDEVDAHVKHLCEIFNSPDGGYVVAPSNSINPDVPFENIEAMFTAIERYSKTSGG